MSRKYFNNFCSPWGEESEHGRRHRCHGEFEREGRFEGWGEDEDHGRRHDV